MVYNPATDFLAIWRNIAGTVSKVNMPGLDYVVAALARAGLINLSVGAAPPGANQDTTAWLQAAVPSYSAEGVLRLWDSKLAVPAYVAATPALLFEMLQASALQLGTSWYTTAGGPPLNTVGIDGDFAIQTDEPGGIYGPKAAGAWPATPIVGTTDIVSSTQLDLTFGNTQGLIIYRGAAVWEALPIGAAGRVLTPVASQPSWATITSLIDALFGNLQGSILYRDAASWDALPPGTANDILVTAGPGANPAWGPRTAEFPSGTEMLFHQTAAPVGWTKSVAFNDYGLRVTSGAVGSVPGSAFSTVFAQTVVGNHTVTIPEMPSHQHVIPLFIPGSLSLNYAGGGTQGGPAIGGQVTGLVGGGGAHNHSVNLTLSYVDVIIASKN